MLMKDETKAALPEGWRWVKLGDVCESASNHDPATEPNDEFCYIDISSIDSNSKKIISPKLLLGTKLLAEPARYSKPAMCWFPPRAQTSTRLR